MMLMMMMVPIVVTLEGIVTVDSDEHSAKAYASKKRDRINASVGNHNICLG